MMNNAILLALLFGNILADNIPEKHSTEELEHFKSRDGINVVLFYPAIKGKGKVIIFVNLKAFRSQSLTWRPNLKNLKKLVYD